LKLKIWIEKRCFVDDQSAPGKACDNPHVYTTEKRFPLGVISTTPIGAEIWPASRIIPYR
jgi:hypothetical protein